MATTMTQPPMAFVPPGTPGSQRVAVLAEPGRIELRHARIPEAGPDEVRIKIKYVGICGSDLEAYKGCRQPEFLAFPTRLGHEVAGTIDQVGARVQGLRVGDRVACRYVWGAFAEYLVCRPFNVLAVPPHLPMTEVSLLEVLPGVLHAAELAAVRSHTNVLITGQGVSGLMVTQVLRLFSPRALAVTDLRPRNLELARAYGATHTYLLPDAHTPTMELARADFPDGFEVVIPCLLDGDGMVDAVDCAALGGRIVMYGCIGVCRRPFDFFKVHRRRLDILSTEPKRDIDMRRFFDEGLRLVETGLLNTGDMITDILPLDEVDRAFALRAGARPDGIHVLIDCERPA